MKSSQIKEFYTKALPHFQERHPIRWRIYLTMELLFGFLEELFTRRKDKS